MVSSIPIYTQLYGIKYSYLIQIISTQLFGIKYFYLIQIICTQLYGIKYSYWIRMVFKTDPFDPKVRLYNKFYNCESEWTWK